MIQWFEDFAKCEKIMKMGIWVSGGTDSALALYLACKALVDNNATHKSIVAMHGYDIRRTCAYSPDAFRKILYYMREEYPNVNMTEYILPYMKEDGEEKIKYHRPLHEWLRIENVIDFSCGAITRSEWDDAPSVRKDMSTIEEPYSHIYLTRKYYAAPMKHMTKRDVAKYYRDSSTLQKIFPHTASCVSMKMSPCRKCWWCKEKAWAFNAYDGDEIDLDHINTY